PIDQSLVGHNQTITSFWLSPSGELLAEVMTASGVATPGSVSASTRVALWRSSDVGAHWQLFPAPTLSSDTTPPYFIVQQPTGTDQPWHICAPYKAGDAALSLACTFDSGRTWSTRPLLCITAPCKPALPFAGQYILASDGAVLAMALAPGSGSQVGIYRLPRDSAKWQYLGPTSGGMLFFVPTSNGGVLWAFTGGAYLGWFSGSIGGHQALPGVLSTATYP
ncbi:MAG TPA: hypothetical protein VFU88_10795, partial [Ktedonobacterales bacterium]|nr:hypothetical protein [Ktedonobacterales bacterium]